MMTDFQKVIFLGALFGFSAIFVSDFITHLTFIPADKQSYALVVGAILQFSVFAYVAKRMGIHFY